MKDASTGSVICLLEAPEEPLEKMPWWFHPYVFIPITGVWFNAIGWGVMINWMDEGFWWDELPYFFKGFGGYEGTAVYGTTKITLWLCGLLAAAALLTGRDHSRSSIRIMVRRFWPCRYHVVAFYLTWLFLRFGWAKGSMLEYGGYELLGLSMLSYVVLFGVALWTRKKSLKVRAAVLLGIALVWPFLLPPTDG